MIKIYIMLKSANVQFVHNLPRHEIAFFLVPIIAQLPLSLSFSVFYLLCER